jgi:hypothetical protein
MRAFYRLCSHFLHRRPPLSATLHSPCGPRVSRGVFSCQVRSPSAIAAVEVARQRSPIVRIVRATRWRRAALIELELHDLLVPHLRDLKLGHALAILQERIGVACLLGYLGRLPSA